MDYNVVVAPDLEVLGKKVNEMLENGWRLKGEIEMHGGSYAQQLVKKPEVYFRKKENKKQRSWIDINSLRQLQQRRA